MITEAISIGGGSRWRVQKDKQTNKQADDCEQEVKAESFVKLFEAEYGT